MKLSEAIRKGATMKPQGFRALFQENGLTGAMASCALGAALDGIASYRIFDFTAGKVLAADFPILGEKPITRHPIGRTNIESTIIFMNDDLRLTREAIADWVEKEELEREFREMEKVINANAEKGLPQDTGIVSDSSLHDGLGEVAVGTR
jgi:hypothetical protein